jgi:hypothetical protein
MAVMRWGAAREAVAHSDGIGADAQVVEVGAIWRRMERAVGSVERGRMAGEEGTVWKWRGEGWASVGGRRRGRMRYMRWWSRILFVWRRWY